MKLEGLGRHLYRGDFQNWYAVQELAAAKAYRDAARQARKHKGPSELVKSLRAAMKRHAGEARRLAIMMAR